LELLIEAGGKLSDEDAKEVVSITDDADKVLKLVGDSVAKNLSLVPAEMKAKLTELEGSAKNLQKRVKEILNKTEEDRARVRCEMHIKEAETQADAVETALNNAECAEGPYLSGMEEIPADDARGVLAALRGREDRGRQGDRLREGVRQGAHRGAQDGEGSQRRRAQGGRREVRRAR